MAFSGQTSSQIKQLTQCLLPKGKTLSFLLVKRITSAPQSYTQMPQPSHLPGLILMGMLLYHFPEGLPDFFRREREFR